MSILKKDRESNSYATQTIHGIPFPYPENVDNQELAAKNDGGTDRPLHTEDERFQYPGETSIVSSLPLGKGRRRSVSAGKHS
ncbi:hypothetical protein TNCT_445311 [Trichonephila clavata]|uniref:Uncharacterized protein n=1 Tax=Trichonephila clavata TaxID=2740835 RepID=A0A8X6KW70_TRICU|nr:hypothetical protein TNCT_445311 [Trichonephila clavata]